MAQAGSCSNKHQSQPSRPNFQEHNFLVFSGLAYACVHGPVLVSFLGVIQLSLRVELSQETNSGYHRDAGVALVGFIGIRSLIEN